MTSEECTMTTYPARCVLLICISTPSKILSHVPQSKQSCCPGDWTPVTSQNIKIFSQKTWPNNTWQQFCSHNYLNVETRFYHKTTYRRHLHLHLHLQPIQCTFHMCNQSTNNVCSQVFVTDWYWFLKKILLNIINLKLTLFQ